MPDIRAEIDSMLGEVKEEETLEETQEETSTETVEEEIVDESEPEDDQESEESPEEEAEEEIPVSEDAEEEGEEVEEPEEEPSEEEPSEPPDDLVAMREQMNRMSDELLQRGIPIPGVDVEPDPVAAAIPVEGQTPVVPAAQQMNLEDLVVLEENANFDEIMENPETFVKFQRNLLQRYGQILEQQFTRAIPNIVQNQVKQVTALNKAVDKFYEQNDDLEVVRPTVGAIADRIVSVHPDWSLDKVMAEAAVTTRKVLRMPGKVKKARVLKPSFAKPKGSKKRIPKPKVSRLQSDIDDLLG